jgi:hypothetical protein
MRTSIRIGRMLVRVLGTVMIVLGLLFWSGNALGLIQLHMLIGVVVVLTLWALAALAARTGEQPGLVLLALLWGLVVPIVGVTQDQLLPGPAHWAIKVFHLLLGVGAIALAEVLARRALGRLGEAAPRAVVQPAHGG